MDLGDLAHQHRLVEKQKNIREFLHIWVPALARPLGKSKPLCSEDPTSMMTSTSEMAVETPLWEISKGCCSIGEDTDLAHHARLVEKHKNIRAFLKIWVPALDKPLVNSKPFLITFMLLCCSYLVYCVMVQWGEGEGGFEMMNLALMIVGCCWVETVFCDL